MKLYKRWAFKNTQCTLAPKSLFKVMCYTIWDAGRCFLNHVAQEGRKRYANGRTTSFAASVCIIQCIKGTLGSCRVADLLLFSFSFFRYKGYSDMKAFDINYQYITQWASNEIQIDSEARRGYMWFKGNNYPLFQSYVVTVVSHHPLVMYDIFWDLVVV